MQTPRELLKHIPPTLRRRTAWFSGYVAQLVAEEEEDRPRIGKLSPDKLQALQFLCTIWLLDKILREGTRAAESAVDEFAKLGVPGFAIGSDTFSGRNPNVRRGAELSDKLRKAFPHPEWFALMDGQSTVRRAVLEAYAEMRRG